MPCLNQYSWWALAGGLVGVGVVAYGMTMLVGRAMQRNLGSSVHRWGWHPRALGVMERILYTLTWVVGKPEFIAWWLALKVAAQWSRWQEPQRQRGSGGRHYFNVFLIGNALSVMFGITGGMVIVWLQGRMWMHALVAVSACWLVGLCLWVRANIGQRSERLEDTTKMLFLWNAVAVVPIVAGWVYWRRWLS